MAFERIDLVQDTATSIGTIAFTMAGTPPQGMQAFSAHTVGASFRYRAFVGSQWEIGTGTWNGATIARSVRKSSSGNALVNFTTAPTVMEVVDAADVAAFLTAGDVPFSQSIPLSIPGSSYMPSTTVASALTFTPAANAVRGALVYLRLTPTTGAPAPDFSAFKEWGGSSGYDNRAGIVNQVQFFCDGYDNWFSASQAVGAVAVAPTASAVTLARSAASGYVGSPVTITVGTDNPLTGSQTESVQLNSNIAGTFSVNPVSLSAATASAASVFTPSAAGAATITGTATGTPSLTAGTIGYTANAVTAPAQMAAPVASAGINSASIAFTVPVNGGAAITGYTVTASTGQTAIGTASPISIAMPSGTPATFTITATNSVGTSSASPASNSVTPTAAAAAPGAPTIGTAVAGDGYVDVVFTAPASNGGAAIIDYTATLSTGQTATGTTSPIRVTAPNGTAVTATVKARNSVNAGPASAASNSVTPAAAAPAQTTSNPRLSPTSNITESGTGPYSYTGGGANATFSNAFGGLSTTGLGAGQDGWLSFVVGGLSSTNEPMLGLNLGAALVTFSNLPCAFYPQGSSSKYIPWTNGSAGTPTSNVTPANGDVMRLRRSGTSVIAEVSKDGGTNFTIIYTWTGQTTAAAKFQVLPEFSSQANNLAGFGLV